MKKCFNRSGFTLIEIMAALLITVLLVVAMGTSMTAGMRIYKDASFESDSASMAGILNTALGDILRYSEDVKVNQGTASNPQAGFIDSDGQYIVREQVAFVFTNVEYGIRDAYFYIPTASGSKTEGILQMKNLKNSNIVELVNTGAYPDLMITDFEITYVEPGAVDASGNILRGGYFDISYDIFSKSDDQKTRSVSTVVRLMNPEA